MSVATINTKATSSAVRLPDEEVDAKFAGLVEAGFPVAPNTSVDLSGFDPVGDLGEFKPPTGIIQTPGTIQEVVVDHAKMTVTFTIPASVIEDAVNDLVASMTNNYYQWSPPSGWDDGDWIASPKTIWDAAPQAVRDHYAKIIQESTHTKLDPVFKAAFVGALRANGDRQCRGAYAWGDKVCGVGLAREVFGNRAVDRDGQMLLQVGFTAAIHSAIVTLNDRAGWTFAQIADWVQAAL